jgi:hypothetical protein
MNAGPRRVTEPLLECYLVDSLDAEARAQVEAVLAESEADRARLAELRAESAAFLVQHSPGPLVQRFESSQRRWWRKPQVLFALEMAVAAAVALLVFVPGKELPGEEPFTTKGGVALALYGKRGESVVRVAPGEALSPGDALRFAVRAEGMRGYVAILSRDAAGVVTVYYPYEEKTAAPYDAQAPLLPGAIELGDVEGEEVVYALFSPEPFGLDWAVSALREGRELEGAAPKRVVVGRNSFVVRKPR